VQQGVHGPPAIPRDAHTHGVSRSTFTASTNVWWHLQRKYSHQNVFRFPATFRGVTILNSAGHESTGGPSSNILERDDDVIAEVQYNMSLSPERTYADVVKGDQNVLRCDFAGCSYSSEKSKSLAMANGVLIQEIRMRRQYLRWIRLLHLKITVHNNRMMSTETQ